jgi:hypothetical protein
MAFAVDGIADSREEGFIVQLELPVPALIVATARSDGLRPIPTLIAAIWIAEMRAPGATLLQLAGLVSFLRLSLPLPCLAKL